ncbi:MAG TPA: MBOAT family O-acyltransferase [Lachnospiraceae bacterium]|nr:MBOAT family O-acyltransferase [Lachnospiraceae bacterium]
MSFMSLIFLIFVAVSVAGYYLIPKKFQWIWLLIFSYIYYISSGIRILFFILFSTAVTYAAGVLMHKIDAAAKAGADDNSSDSRNNRESERKLRAKKKKTIIVLALLLNFGMLAVIKYSNFAITNINMLFGSKIEAVDFLLPLGISFYTFQATGYILDVYWGRCEAELNPLRYALFVSFFPQIMQGPIGRYSRLAHQLYEKHAFDPVRTEKALMRIAYGYFKKIIIADGAYYYMAAVFNSYADYPGVGLLGVLAYSAELYADFSGGIDIVIGIAELFGITMDENFRQPFFSISITDFWHRWHITLGTWMKDYLFYPISLSGWMGKFGKFCRSKMGKTIGRALPICIANIIVFLVVGIWHGPAWHYIFYGLYNGIIIGISGLLAKPFRNWKKALHITDKTRWFHIFQIVRTFILVNISWFFDCSDTLPQAFTMIRNFFTHFDFSPFFTEKLVVVGNGSLDITFINLYVVLAACAVVFTVSVLRERQVDVRSAIIRWPFAFRAVLYIAVIFAIPMLGHTPSVEGGGFIYANF